MTLLGHGVDVVEVKRIERLLSKDDDFLLGWFTSGELDQLSGRASKPAVIAGRVAAKEAVVKALGCGFDDQVSWQDVEIISTDTGQPTVHLSGGAAVISARLGVTSVLLSISNEATISVASAIVIGSAMSPSK